MITIEIKTPKKLKTEKSAFVSFDFDSIIVSTIRELPFKYYDVDNKTWEIPVDKVNYLITKLHAFDFTIKGDINIEVDENLPEGFKFKTKPFEHQREALSYGLKCDTWLLGDEQGLGKTKTVIDLAIARKLKYGYKHCLIVCGVNTLKWNWVNEIHTHSDESGYILGQKVSKGKLKIGSTNDKISDLKKLETDENLPYFIITNVESFRDENFAKIVQDLCKKEIINMCAADEMHKMKNPTAQQTKGFLKCQPKCKIAMTGTPLMNTPLDLYVILKWLGYESHAFYSFKQHYCVMGGYGGYEIVGYRNMEQLTRQVNEIMLRRLKSEVLDLPEKVYIDEYVDMGNKQGEIYKNVELDLKSNLDLIASNPNPLAQLIRLRQATGYTGILSSEIQESAKLERMEDLVEEARANNQKVVIFSNWTQMTDVIYDKLAKGKYGVSVITGNTKDEDRQTIVEMFQDTNNCNVLIGTIGAMGTGLTLTAGTVVIFVDEPWNKALYEQAVDRCHRIGQKNNITIYNLLTKDTIDERIHKIVYEKGIMSDAIIDGKIVGNKTDLINYLIG